MAGSTELIVALDVDSRREALDAVAACEGCQWFKIGAQLFTRCGPEIVQEVCGHDKRVFLDLKFLDIPNTVGQAARAAADLGVSLFTIHASGGRRMIAAAREAVEGSSTRILAVTVLTSLSDEVLREEVGLAENTAAVVRRYVRLAVGAGAHGVVASAQEIALIRDVVGPEPLVVTPGIRPAWSGGKDDQVRVMTPADAARAGANYIVVGRPILRHPRPAEAVRLVLAELEG
jgi:orotidine-5'-phosphate decarboxylase